MRNFQKEKRQKYFLRAKRTRSKISGTAERPRASIFRSIQHIYVQLIDDVKGVTLVEASDREIKKSKDADKKIIAREVGKLAAVRASKAGITTVVFDRRGYQYHGRVLELAEGMREKGIEF